MTVKEAREKRVCRVCGEKIPCPPGQPLGWESEFRERLYPNPLTLNFGEEFAHPACLEKEKAAAKEG